MKVVFRKMQRLVTQLLGWQDGGLDAGFARLHGEIVGQPSQPAAPCDGDEVRFFPALGVRGPRG